MLPKHWCTSSEWELLQSGTGRGQDHRSHGLPPPVAERGGAGLGGTAGQRGEGEGRGGEGSQTN